MNIMKQKRRKKNKFCPEWIWTHSPVEVAQNLVFSLSLCDSSVGKGVEHWSAPSCLKPSPAMAWPLGYYSWNCLTCVGACVCGAHFSTVKGSCEGGGVTMNKIGTFLFCISSQVWFEKFRLLTNFSVFFINLFIPFPVENFFQIETFKIQTNLRNC